MVIIKIEVDMNKILGEKYEEKFKDFSIGYQKINKLLGYGKSAAVFSTIGPSNLVIKIFDNEIISRFGTEAQIERIKNEISLKDHNIENLVKIIDGGTFEHDKENYYYIMMEYIEGINLKEYIKNNGPQNELFAKNVFKTLYSVTEKLLARGIVHRDIKPENIMVSDNEIKLMDLGVIKIIDNPSITDVGDYKPFIGTLRYAPPEFLLREEKHTKEAFRAINIYQIGATLHDIIMGNELFYQYSEPYSKVVIAVTEETPIIQRLDYNYKFINFINNLLIKDPISRIGLFSKVNIEELLKNTDNKSGDDIDEIMKMTMGIKNKLENIKKINLKAKQHENIHKNMRVLTYR